MDIGLFISSPRRLTAWLIIPPLLISCFGLSSYAWRQRAHWQLQETKELTEILPPFFMARKSVIEMVDGFRLTTAGEIGSEDQLISFLQEAAPDSGFMVDTVNVTDQNRMKVKKPVSVLNAVVLGTGSFTAIQLYINEVKSSQRLLSVSSMKIVEADEAAEGYYDTELIFELLLLDELKVSSGGAQ